MIPLLRLRRPRRTAVFHHPAHRLPVAGKGFAAAAKQSAMLLAALFIAASAGAQEGAPVNANVDYRLVALRVAEDFAEPRYGVLFTRALAQKEAWNAFCAVPPNEAAFEQLQVQFKNAVMAWSNVEMLRYGPVSEDFLYERIAYWPERRNDVERGLATLLSGDDTLTSEAMFGKSVAVQGLPALERLLYEEGAREALFAGDDNAKRRCEAGVAISANIEELARRIRDLWPKLKDRLRQDDASLAREAVSRIATDLLTIYQIVGDLKLDRVAGPSPEEARPRSAQWWRSGLSNEAIAYNMKSAADLIWLFLGPGPERHALMVAIGAAERNARDLPAPLPDMAGEAGARGRLILLRNMVRSARDLSADYVPPKLGIMIGFNSLDGD